MPKSPHFLSIVLMDVCMPALPSKSAVTLNIESISADRVLMGKFSFGLKEWLDIKCDSRLHTVIWASLQSVNSYLMHCTTLHNFKYHSVMRYKVATRKWINRNYIFYHLRTKKEHNQGNSSNCMFCTDTTTQQTSQFGNSVCFLFFPNNFDTILPFNPFLIKRICDIWADRILFRMLKK